MKDMLGESCEEALDTKNNAGQSNQMTQHLLSGLLYYAQNTILCLLIRVNGMHYT